ncbi:MAG: glycosyltransferase [Chthoniobacterales bacterium]|nr:glycosyltransferase [Chthoniobacterales bacterium]
MEKPKRAEETSLISNLRLRERYRDDYWQKHDPIAEDRLLWRAQAFRHIVHLLPGQRILELGCGEGRLTHALLLASRGENPITAVTFQDVLASGVAPKVEQLHVSQLPGPLTGRRFDCIIAMDLLDRSTSSELLGIVHELLAPGGEMVFYESNPWNPVHEVRGALLRLAGKRDPRNLLDRPRLYELLSEIGFIRIYAVFNDFVFAPLTRSLIWLLRNLSIVLENAPVVRTMAGSILVHAQKPPREKELPHVSLFAHESLRGAVSVVIPCHNEEMNVGPLVERMLALYGEYIREVILVNDGSTDATGEVISQLAAKDARVRPLHRLPPNGVGLAIADGLQAATGQYVLTADCDFQHLLPEFRDLFDGAAEGYDVVIGSRFSRHSVLLNYPFFKILANRAFHTLAVLLFGRRIRDVTNNLKMMRREVVANLRLLQPGFAVNAETGLQPILLGYRVKQVPISWINRTPGMGTSSFRLVHVGGGYWRVLGGLWLKYAFGIGPYRALTREDSESSKGLEAAASDQVGAGR